MCPKICTVSARSLIITYTQSKQHSIFFSLGALASKVVNRVTVWTRDNYNCFCSPFAVEALVLRVLWGEMRVRRTLAWKVQERGAKYLASSLPRAVSWDSIGAAIGSCGCECWQGSAPCGSIEKHSVLLTVAHRQTCTYWPTFYREQT